MLSHKFYAISQFQAALQNSGQDYCIINDAKVCIDNLNRQFEENLADENLKIMAHKLSNIKSLIKLIEEVRSILDVLGLLSSSTYTKVSKVTEDVAIAVMDLYPTVLSLACAYSRLVEVARYGGRLMGQNQKLADLSPSSSPVLIDGILTKFDNIDDNVGAALSMVYISGSLVMIDGCGQSYTDLKKLNV